MRNNLAPQDLKSIAEFHRVIKNYLKMKMIDAKK